MKLFYKNAGITETDLSQKIHDAAERLMDKLLMLDIPSIGLSEYNQNYLMENLKNPLSTIQQNTYLLYLSLKNGVPPEEFTLVDYGGGSGLFSILAKELGLKRVIYNDIYDISCKDIIKLSTALNLKIDEIICGELDDVISFLLNNNYSVNGVCSFDVIEHIYDMEDYLRGCKSIPGENLKLVFGSGAIAQNPLIKMKLQKSHLLFENNDRPNKFGHKQRDSLTSFMKIRKEIIKLHSRSLNNENIEKLVLATRGLRIDDIVKCVDNFIETGEINYLPNHPTNTCDPLTGNWNEQLLNTDWLKSILESEGFETSVLPGFWGDSEDFYKTSIKRLFNVVIKTSKRFCFTIAPYYIIYAFRRP